MRFVCCSSSLRIHRKNQVRKRVHLSILYLLNRFWIIILLLFKLGNKKANHKNFTYFTLFIKIYNETWNENFSLQFHIIFRFFLLFLFPFVVLSRFVSLIFLFNIVTRVCVCVCVNDDGNGGNNKIRTMYVSSFVKLANSRIKMFIGLAVKRSPQTIPFFNFEFV